MAIPVPCSVLAAVKARLADQAWPCRVGGNPRSDERPLAAVSASRQPRASLLGDRELAAAAARPHKAATEKPEEEMSFLRASGNSIVDEVGNTVTLHGIGLAGWLNMENWVIGYPAHEQGMRDSVHRVLGEKRADFFFERFVDYFFAAADVAFMSDLGINAVRIPFHYAHLESDDAPFEIREQGLHHSTARSTYARNAIQTPSLICIPCRDGRIRTGTRTTRPTPRSSGATAPSRIASYTSGRCWLNDTQRTRGLPDTTSSTNRRIPPERKSARSTAG